MKSSILVYLSLWSLCVASVASQKVRGSSGTHRKTRRVQQNRTTFESYFEIDYVANGSGDIDFSLVGQALAIAYNNLLEPRFSNEEDAKEYSLYDDPFNRRMELVEVLRVDGLRRLTEAEEPRELQSSSLRNLNVYLRVTGSCNGCPSRSRFTNQVRRRKVKEARKLSKRRLQEKDSKKEGGGKGGSGTIPPTTLSPIPPPISTPPPVLPPISTPPPVLPPISTLAPIPRPTLAPVPPPISTPAPVPSPTLAPVPPVTMPPTMNANTPPPVFVTLAPTIGAATAPPVPRTPPPTPPPFDDPSTLPTEEELRLAYALEINRWEFDIVDVVALDELDGPITPTTNCTRSDLPLTSAGNTTQIIYCP